MKTIINTTILLLSTLLFLQIIYSQTNYSDVAGSDTVQHNNTNEYKKTREVDKENVLKFTSKDVIVITATKTKVKRSDICTSITVITADEIKKRGKRTVLDVLKDVPGVTISQNSAFGGQSSIFMRGSNKSGHTLVMIDGIEMNDPISVDKSFNITHLTTDNIEQIEVIRGPLSTLYGSDAIGGVINVITKKGEGKLDVKMSAEAGSYNTFKEYISINGAIKKFNYSLLISRMDSGGISKAAEKKNTALNYENDSYDNTTFSSRIGFMPVQDILLDLYLRYSIANFDMDDDSFEDDPNHISDSKNFAGKLEYKHILNNWWEYKLFYSYMDIVQTDKDKTDDIDVDEYLDSWYKGNTQKIEWQHNFYLADIDIITCGIEYEEEKGSFYYHSESMWGPYISQLKEKKIDNKGYYLQNQFNPFDSDNAFYIAVGIRLDDHKVFGQCQTINYKISWNFKKTGTQLKGNFGTGFKAPTIYQLYSEYGNLKLKPEKSDNYDIGIKQDLLNNKIIVDLTYFHNDFKNLIIWKNNYTNADKVETKGAEIGISVKPIKVLSLNLDYTLTETKDKKTKQKLIRIPEHKCNFNINWTFIKNANANLGLNYMGEREDYDFSTFPYKRITLKEYLTVNLAAHYQITKIFQVSGRIENLFNKDYQTAFGYTMPGRAYYGGVKADF